MFFSDKTVLTAISSLKEIRSIGGNRDILAYYLALSRLGMSCFEYKNKDVLFEDRNKALQCLHDLGGMFDPTTESVEKKGCLFFTSFHKTDSDFNENIFYNQGTVFTGLPGRLKDTIDNTISDFLLETGPKKYYRFRTDYETCILQSYNFKYPLYALLVWLNRFRNFDFIDLNNIRKLFIAEYRLTEDVVSKLFSSSAISISQSDKPVLSSAIRKFLHINDMVEVVSEPDATLPIEIITLNSTDISNAIGGKYIMDAKLLTGLLDKYKQIILTGVPGTGKSYLIDEIAPNYNKVYKVQFHPNYTYQDFVMGKIISNGSILPAPGKLLQILAEISSDNGSKGNKYLLALDEINRGNLSSIFGELFYALDRDKAITIQDVAGKDYNIALPPNLHIIGTMNSADRSIALVDYAVRRRFCFIELEPNHALVNENSTFNSEMILGDMLQKFNENIVKYFKNKDYRLGHSYFIKGKGKTDWKAEDVHEVIQFKIIPMLVEYAQGDHDVVKYTITQDIADASPKELFAKVKLFMSTHEE